MVIQLVDPHLNYYDNIYIKIDEVMTSTMF
jgi:hypothetical protein